MVWATATPTPWSRQLSWKASRAGLSARYREGGDLYLPAAG